MKMTERHGWIWPKPRNVNCVNLTKNWQQWACSCWTWPITIEFDQKSEKSKNNTTTNNILCWIWPKIVNSIYSLVHVCHCGDIHIIFGFRSYSTENVRRYGNYINYDFGQFHKVNVRHCQFSVMFTDVGHIHSVKLTTLHKKKTHTINPRKRL